MTSQQTERLNDGGGGAHTSPPHCSFDDVRRGSDRAPKRRSRGDHQNAPAMPLMKAASAYRDAEQKLKRHRVPRYAGCQSVTLHLTHEYREAVDRLQQNLARHTGIRPSKGVVVGAALALLCGALA